MRTSGIRTSRDRTSGGPPVLVFERIIWVFEQFFELSKLFLFSIPRSLNNFRKLLIIETATAKNLDAGDYPKVE